MSRLTKLDALQIRFEGPSPKRLKSSPRIEPAQKAKKIVREYLKLYTVATRICISVYLQETARF